MIDSISVPATPGEAAQVGLDIEGDNPDDVDNAFGQFLVALSSTVGLDLQAGVDDAVTHGQLLHLLAVQAPDLAQAAGCAAIGVYFGANPSTAPCRDRSDMFCGRHLDGTTTFDVDPRTPLDPTLRGSLAGGQFNTTGTTSPGIVAIDMVLGEGSSPFELELHNPRMTITKVSKEGVVGGILGGALTEHTVDTSIYPALTFTDAVERDCPNDEPPCCEAGTAGETAILLFDEDDSCDISLEEVRNSSLLASVLSPDVDLFDANGQLNPNVDGVPDSLSLGLGFSAVTAEFTPPVY